MTATIEISCASCRKSKPSQLGMSVCKHKPCGEFYAYDGKACELWLPSIHDVRIRLAREAEKEARFREWETGVMELAEENDRELMGMMEGE